MGRDGPRRPTVRDAGLRGRSVEETGAPVAHGDGVEGEGGFREAVAQWGREQAPIASRTSLPRPLFASRVLISRLFLCTTARDCSPSSRTKQAVVVLARDEGPSVGV